jgi:zinc transport system substrate-binding protein
MLFTGKDIALPCLVVLLALYDAVPVLSQGEEPPCYDRTIHAYVGIPPQAYFVERIAGNNTLIEVSVLLAPGQSPATYDPTPKDMAGLSKADVYFLIGLPFEKKLIEKASIMIKDFNVVDAREGITLRQTEEYYRRPDPHGHHGQKPARDPHIWLNPQLVKIISRNICDELGRLDPVHAGEYEGNLKQFEVDLDKVDSTITELLAPYNDLSFYVFHPTFGYFGDRYGLRQVAVETAGKEPGARELVEIIEKTRKDKIRVVIVQPEFSSKSARAIAHAIGGRVVTVNPLARDYLNNLVSMAGSIRDALGEN